MTHSTLTRTSTRGSAPRLRPTPDSLQPQLLRILRARLEIQRDFRIDQLAALDSLDPTDPLASVDEEVLDSLCTGAATALRDVRHALWRLDEGCYGRCVDCTRPLDVVRLAAVPQTARCLSCERAEHAA